MAEESDEAYYRRRAEQELHLAGRAATPEVRTIHLNLAAKYATAAELAARGEKNPLGLAGEDRH